MLYRTYRKERPIGADVTVTSAQPKKIDMELTIIKDEMHTLEQVKAILERAYQTTLQRWHLGRIL